MSEVIEKDTKISQTKTVKSVYDYFSLGFSTCGVGYLPLAPGTWGSIVGVLIYLVITYFEKLIINNPLIKHFNLTSVYAWLWVINLILFLILCFIGVKTSKNVAQMLGKKDPQIIVIDEVMGILLLYLFVPILESGWLILAGFILFRLFDIIKPYPIRSLENLPDGIGVCADDLLAGVYGGICLSVLYAISLSF